MEPRKRTILYSYIFIGFFVLMKSIDFIWVCCSFETLDLAAGVRVSSILTSTLAFVSAGTFSAYCEYPDNLVRKKVGLGLKRNYQIGNRDKRGTKKKKKANSPQFKHGL